MAYHDRLALKRASDVASEDGAGSRDPAVTLRGGTRRLITDGVETRVETGL